MGFKEDFFGEGDRYDYKSMCMPSNPFRASSQKPTNFYSKDEKIPYLLAAIMGLQHAFAMVGGLITPPLVIFRFTVCGFPFCSDLEQYAISAGLISSGVCSLLNVSKLPIPFTKRIVGTQLYIGSGVLSVMGTSFTFLPVFEVAIAQMKLQGITGREAYGKMLGTSMITCLLELGLSFMPIQYIKRVFPPLVTSITVMLIGVGLTGSGMKYWGGGVVCAEMVWKDHAQVIESGATFGPPFSTCQNGETNLGYGSAEYIGLGFSVIVALVFIEVFGSVFMKNCNVIIALLIGFFIAGVSNYNGQAYVLTDNIKSADPITFLWVETFPLGFYGPAVIPLLISYLVTTVETVGDITAVHEVSEIPTSGDAYRESVQGGLTSDAISSLLAGLFTTMPNTTFSQNNGVISMTKCASRRAGYACGVWLILMGVFSKIAGVITSIPDCVLGGMTIFLFANVMTSGISLAGSLDLHSRRTKFILAVSLAVGVGVSIWPFAFQDMRGSTYTAHFWTCQDCNETMKGIRDGVSIFLSTGYCVGTVIAMLLNGILPEDAGVAYSADFKGRFNNDPDEVVKEKKLSEEEEIPTKEDINQKVSMEETDA